MPLDFQFPGPAPAKSLAQPSDHHFSHDEYNEKEYLEQASNETGEKKEYFKHTSIVSTVVTLLPAQSMHALRATCRAIMSVAGEAFNSHCCSLYPQPLRGSRMDGQDPFDSFQHAYGMSTAVNHFALIAGGDADFNAFVQAAKSLLPDRLNTPECGFFLRGSDRRLLHCAAICGNLPAARWLLQHGASPLVKETHRHFDCYGYASHWTPLHHAARNGDVRMCKLLLAAGACPHALTLVHHTAMGGKKKKIFDEDGVHYTGSIGLTLKSRVYKGRKVFYFGKAAGSTPVQLAQKLGHTAAVELLQGWPHNAPVRARRWKDRLRPARVLQDETEWMSGLRHLDDDEFILHEDDQEDDEFILYENLFYDQEDYHDDFNLKQLRARMWQFRREQRTEQRTEQRQTQQRRMTQRRHLIRPQGPRNRRTSRRQTRCDAHDILLRRPKVQVSDVASRGFRK